MKSIKKFYKNILIHLTIFYIFASLEKAIKLCLTTLSLPLTLLLSGQPDEMWL